MQWQGASSFELIGKSIKTVIKTWSEFFKAWNASTEQTQKPGINLRGRVCVLQTGVRARELLTPI